MEVGKIAQNKGYYAVQGHQCRYRKPVSDFLFVINTNRRPISYRFEVIADYCLNFGHCFFSPLWGLRATYTVHLRLIGKLVVDFLFVLIELFR